MLNNALTKMLFSWRWICNVAIINRNTSEWLLNWHEQADLGWFLVPVNRLFGHRRFCGRNVTETFLSFQLIGWQDISSSENLWIRRWQEHNSTILLVLLTSSQDEKRRWKLYCIAISLSVRFVVHRHRRNKLILPSFCPMNMKINHILMSSINMLSKEKIRNENN